MHGRGRLAEDILRALARHRIDLRHGLVTRVDRSPRDLVEHWGGSPLGVLWQGRATVRQRLGPRTPIEGVYAAGAHAATPGSRTAVRGPVVAVRWSRRRRGGVANSDTRWARHRRQTDTLSAAKISQRRLRPVQRVEVQAGRAACEQLLAQLGAPP